jgi:hypothetical protein
MVLMAAVFSLVFWPYTNFRGEEFDLENTLDTLVVELGAATSYEAEFAGEVDYFKKAMVAFYEKHELLSARGLHEEREHQASLRVAQNLLRNWKGAQLWLAGEAERPVLSGFSHDEQEVIRSFEADECFWFREEKWIQCTLRQGLQELNSLYRPYHSGGHVSQLRNELGGELRERLDNSQASFSACLAGYAENWKTHGRTVDCGLAEFGLFVDHQYRLVNEYQNELSSQLYDQRRKIKVLNNNIAGTEKSLTDIRGRIQEIASLQNIDTPLGAIPLGVNDLVMIFPVLLAAGFYLYVSLLLEALHIRGAYRKHSQQLDPRMFSNAHIALIAPLWIDHLGNIRQWLPRLFILFLPAIVFTLSLLLLLGNGLLRGSFLDEVLLSGWVYYLAYVVCALLFVSGAHRVFGIFRL